MKTKVSCNNSNNNNNNTLFLVGGTGSLGLEIAQGLRTSEKNFDAYKALVRDDTTEQAKALAQKGWELVVVKDMLNDQQALQDALKDAKVIVSTFGKGDIVKLEMAVIDAIVASKKNNKNDESYPLFVPSQFGVDYRRWNLDETHPFLLGKRQVLDYAKQRNVPTLSVFTGYFSDFIFEFLANPKQGTARMINDGTGKVSFTKRSDIGYVLAKAFDDNEEGIDTLKKVGTLSMHGTTLPYKDALDILSKALGGKPLKIETLDTDVAKQAEKDALEKGLTGDMGSFYESFALHLLGMPQRRGNNTGADTSNESKTYGYEMESLETTLNKIYGTN